MCSFHDPIIRPKVIGTQKGTSMDKLVDTYCDVDGFCKLFIE